MEDVVSDIPLITNDAVVFGILIALLLLIFKTAETPSFSKFYKIIPALLLCYFLPSLFSTVGIISPKWIDMSGAIGALGAAGFDISELTNFKNLKNFVLNTEGAKDIVEPFIGRYEIDFGILVSLDIAISLIIWISLTKEGSVGFSNVLILG